MNSKKFKIYPLFSAFYLTVGALDRGLFFFYIYHNRTYKPSELMGCGFFKVMPKATCSNFADGSII